MDGWDIMVRMIFPFSRPFPQLDFSMHLVAPWLTFGALVAHFWFPWFPFGSFLEPFVSLLAPFGSLWLTFGTLFEEIMKTFINSIHFHEFVRLVNNFYEFSCFSRHHC